MTRLWSLHPGYLDQKGLGACWKEAKGAQTSLMNPDAGGQQHSALIRFRAHHDPVGAIGAYMRSLWVEAALRRNYRYNYKLIAQPNPPSEVYETNFAMPVTKGQVQYEAEFLREKINKRDGLPRLYLPSPNTLEAIRLHPLFYMVEGDVEDWERVK